MVCCAVVGLILPGLVAGQNVSRVKHRSRGLVTLLVFLGGFIYNGAVFQTPQIKHSNAAVSSTAHKNIIAVSTKTNVKNFLIVCDQLGLGS